MATDSISGGQAEPVGARDGACVDCAVYLEDGHAGSALGSAHVDMLEADASEAIGLAAVDACEHLDSRLNRTAVSAKSFVGGPESRPSSQPICSAASAYSQLRLHPSSGRMATCIPSLSD